MAMVDAFLEGTAGAPDSPGDIVLDLTRLTFIDSSGLKAVAKLAQRLTGSSSFVAHRRTCCVSRHPGRQQRRGHSHRGLMWTLVAVRAEAAIVNVTLEDGTPIIVGGAVAPRAPSVRIVTNSFTAAAGTTTRRSRMHSSRQGQPRPRVRAGIAHTC